MKKEIDEPWEQQYNEIKDFTLKHKLSLQLEKECDHIFNAKGEFGLEPANPIPVNGPIGELKYLYRLVCPCNVVLLYHRIGCIWYDAYNRVLDIYETVCLNGEHWNIFYFDLHFTRRSTLLPNGYTTRQFGSPVFLYPIINGVNSYVNNFPLKLTNHLRPDFKMTIFLDPRRTYNETMEVEKYQAIGAVELRESINNEIVRKSLNGLARIIFDSKHLYIKPIDIENKLSEISKLISGRIVATKDEDILLM